LTFVSSSLPQFGVFVFILGIAALLVSRSISERGIARHIRRVVNGETQSRAPLSTRTLVVDGLRALGRFVQGMSVLSNDDVLELNRAARSAGFSPDTAVPVVIGGKLVLMVTCPAVAYLLARGFEWPWPIVATCAGVCFGMFGPNVAIGFARRKRLRALRLGLSDALDLLVVCAEAGLGLESAIDRVSNEMQISSPDVAYEFSTLGQDLRLSSDRGAALLRMGERTGLDSFQRLTMTLAQTLRYGTPLGQALRILATELRNDRMLRLEEKAAKLPTLMMIPLAIFILPCLFIVVAGPAALRIMKTLG
jgi:tight adherence protein C